MPKANQVYPLPIIWIIRVLVVLVVVLALLAAYYKTSYDLMIKKMNALTTQQVANTP